MENCLPLTWHFGQHRCSVSQWCGWCIFVVHCCFIYMSLLNCYYLWLGDCNMGEEECCEKSVKCRGVQQCLQSGCLSCNFYTAGWAGGDSSCQIVSVSDNEWSLYAVQTVPNITSVTHFLFVISISCISICLLQNKILLKTQYLVL